MSSAKRYNKNRAGLQHLHRADPEQHLGAHRWLPAEYCLLRSQPVFTECAAGALLAAASLRSTILLNRPMAPAHNRNAAGVLPPDRLSAPTADYVDGEILERNVGEFEHAFFAIPVAMLINSAPSRMGLYGADGVCAFRSRPLAFGFPTLVWFSAGAPFERRYHPPAPLRRDHVL